MFVIMIVITFQNIFYLKIYRNIFFLKKLFLTSIYQNDKKTLKKFIESK